MSDARDTTGTGVHPHPTESSPGSHKIHHAASLEPTGNDLEVTEIPPVDDTVVSEGGEAMDIDLSGVEVDMGMMEGLVHFDEDFDQDTLDNLAALSRFGALGEGDDDTEEREMNGEEVFPVEDQSKEMQVEDAEVQGEEKELSDMVDFSSFLPEVRNEQETEEAIQAALRDLEVTRQSDVAGAGAEKPSEVAVGDSTEKEKGVEVIASEQEGPNDTLDRHASPKVPTSLSPLDSKQDKGRVEDVPLADGPKFLGVRIPEALPAESTSSTVQSSLPDAGESLPVDASPIPPSTSQPKSPKISGTASLLREEQPDAGPSRPRSPSPRPASQPATLATISTTDVPVEEYTPLFKSRSSNKGASRASSPGPRPILNKTGIEKRGLSDIQLDDEGDSGDDRTGDEDGEDGDFEETKYGYVNGKMKRKRNRTVL